MRKQAIRFTLMLAVLVSIITIGGRSINAAAVTVPVSGVTAAYDLADGNVHIIGDGTYVINQSNPGQATGNVITISSNATVYLNGVNILVPVPSGDTDHSKSSPIKIDGQYQVDLYIVDSTENILNSAAGKAITDEENNQVDTGSGRAGIRVPWGATLNIYGSSGSLTARGATGNNYAYGAAHGGGGAGIGGSGGYKTKENYQYEPEAAGFVNIYGGRINAIGGDAGGYWGGGGNGIGGGGASYYYVALGSSSKASLFGGTVTATGGSKGVENRPSGYGIGGAVDLMGGTLIAKSAAVYNRPPLSASPALSGEITTYAWRTSASAGYTLYPETAYTYSGTETYVEFITPDSGIPVLTAGAVSRTGDTQGTVKFTSSKPGTYYYEVVADGASAPAISTSGAGTSCTTAETMISDPAGLTAGAKDIYIKVKDLWGNVSETLKLDIPAYVKQVSSWAELKTAVQNAPTGEAETIIEITQSFSTDWIYGTIYDWSSGGVGKNITIQSAAGGPYTITRGANHLTSFFANDYDLGTLTLKNIILDGNGSNITASKAMLYKAGGTWILESGAKLQNIKANVGGGYAAGVQNQGGTFIMKEGSSIVNAVNTADFGTGGVRNLGTFIMEGGSITGCAGHGYGGVYSTGPLTISGKITITGNETNSGSDSDLTLYTASGIVNIAAAGLHADARIGIANLSVPYTITGSSSQDYSGNFFSNWPLVYTIVNTGTGDAQVVKLVSKTASYEVERYLENLAGDGYTLMEEETEYKSGTLGSSVTASDLTFTGFSENTSHEGRVASGTLTYGVSTVLKLYYTRNTYTVTFKDHDGTILKEQSVKYEGAGTAPAEPVRKDYVFDSWDAAYTAITGNLTVNALYTKLKDPLLEVVGSDKKMGVEADGLEGAVGFSDEERLNEDISIRLEVNLLDEETVPKGDKDLLDAYSAENLKLNAGKMLLLNISLFKVVGETETEVTNADQEITIRFILPEEYRNQDFRIARVHDGKVEILEHTYDKDTFEVTFRTDKFSTYGLVFQPAATVTVLPKTGSFPAAAGITLVAGLVLVSLGNGVIKKQSEKQD